ncbi:MAG: type II toxin-antitoxin system Phd/YefM family antitoxin [bacterium]|nr:type II toxin-antitoxin system Phd/YefM family antitoxin [bacterium]
MAIVNISEAKTHLSRLVQRVSEGEKIIIAKAGKPVAKLVPYSPSGKPRQPGFWKGRVRMADDFDVLPEDMAAAFRDEAE